MQQHAETLINSSGIGMVARDDRGELLLARTLYIQDMSSPEMAEGLAFKEALSWNKTQSWPGSR